MSDARGPVWTSTVPRVLLVLAVVLGLCAMHVLAAAVSQQHTAVHDVSASRSASPLKPVSTSMPASSAPTMDHTTSATSLRSTDHEHHHSTGDCVLFLSAGIALVVVLLAWAAARALRPSYWLTEPWLGRVIAVTPWRGPPPWHSPRISLCVIRV